MAKRIEKKKAAGRGISGKVSRKSLAKKGTTDVEVEEKRMRLKRDWFWGLLLLGSVLLTYQSVWHAGFIWDDDLLIAANPCVVGPLGLKEIWTTNAADICPLTITVFWVEHALWGLAPLPYHLVNVLLHGMCAILLWRVGRNLQIPGAWLGAALWALHPVQVESVAWIAETKNTLSGFFFLLAILFFVKKPGTGNKNDQSPNSWNDLLVLLFASLAMAAKSSAVTLPLVLCLCAWWREGRWNWINLIKVAPIFLVSLIIGSLSIWTQKLAGAGDPVLARSWPERLATAGDAVWFYLGKLVWPYPLITVYPRWEINVEEWYSYLPSLGVALLLFVLWFKRRSWFTSPFFIFVCFLATLLPVLGLANMNFFRYSFVADHFQYLASMGPLVLIGAGLSRFSAIVLPGKTWLQSILSAGLLLTLGTLSWQQVRVYENQETLWTDTLVKNPDCWVAHNGLGAAFFQKGQVDEAIGQFQKALEINPNYTEAHSNLGLAFLQKERTDEALEQFQKAMEISPRYFKAYGNLGNALLQKGRVDQAIEQYQKALKINPGHAETHNNLGNAFLQKGQAGEAMEQFRKALEIRPALADAHYNLGNIFAQKGNEDEAIKEFQKALEIDPGNARTHNNLGNALLRKGQATEAMEQFQKALQINPAFAEAHNNLGNALTQEKRTNEAMGQFQKALEINPALADAHYNLGNVLAHTGRIAEAMEQYKQVLKFKPDHAQARHNLEILQALPKAAPVKK